MPSVAVSHIISERCLDGNPDGFGSNNPFMGAYTAKPAKIVSLSRCHASEFFSSLDDVAKNSQSQLSAPCH